MWGFPSQQNPFRKKICLFFYYFDFVCSLRTVISPNPTLNHKIILITMINVHITGSEDVALEVH